ncbi:MAG: hypothetical protein JST59_14740 [Actinobacteria bacterium]|nr:hypothetical protein [Actinomycetota bacterium]
MDPVVRPEVHDAYWRFAAERHRIFEDRLQGTDAPWSADPILATFKFCNAYRVLDRVSQYLVREVIYGDQALDMNAEDCFMRIVLFRLFSKETTWETLEGATGGLTLSTLDIERLGDELEELRSRQPIYTSAFILAAPSVFGHAAKHRNHLALVSQMFRNGGLGRALARAASLEEVYKALVAFPMIGPFLGYQIAIDLNYSDHLDFDEDEFTVPGPGALRGIAKVFSDPGSRTPEELIMRMVERQEDEFARLGIDFHGLFGRPLKAIDCQNLFCETDKYSREAFPALKSNRTRIKARFVPSGPLPSVCLPPKWGLGGPVLTQREELVDPTLSLRRAGSPAVAFR